jgi:hypothetical protein
VNLLKAEQLRKNLAVRLLESARQVNAGELVDSFGLMAQHRGTGFRSSRGEVPPLVVVVGCFLPWR